MAWIVLLAQTALVIVVCAVLGSLLVLCAGARRLSHLALGPLALCLAVGLASLASPVTGWSWPVVLLEVLVTCVVLLAVRSLTQRTAPMALVSEQGSGLLSPVRCCRLELLCLTAGLLVNALGYSLMLVKATGGDPSTLLQLYDNPFHYSVVRSIVATGNASPIGAGSVMGTATAVYPDLWHALLALEQTAFGLSIQAAVWVVVLVILTWFGSISMALLTLRLTEPGQRWSRCVALGAGAMTPLLGLGLFVTFGSIFSNFLGLALLPAACAWAMDALPKGWHWRDVPRALVPLAVSVVARGRAHPNTDFLLLIFVLCLAVARARGVWSRAAVLGLGAAVWAVCLKSSLFYRTVNCLDRVGDSALQGQGWYSRLHLSYDGIGATPWGPLAVALAIFAVALIVAWLCRRFWRNSWFIGVVGALVALTFLTFYPANEASVVLTGFWYRDYFRLYYISCYFAVPCGVALMCAAAGALARPRGAHGTPARWVRPVAVCAIAAAFALMGLKTCRSVYGDIAWATRGVTANANHEWLTPEGASFSEQVAEICGDAVVLNNANDQSVWLYPAYGVNALVKGRPANQMSSMDPELAELIAHVDAIGEDSATGEAVRAAAHDLGVEYVVRMSDLDGMTMEFNDLDQIQYEGRPSTSALMPDTPGLDLVLEQDGMELWRLAA